MVAATLASLLITPIYLAKFSSGEVLGQAAFIAAIVGGFNQVRGAIAVMFDGRTNLANEVVAKVRAEHKIDVLEPFVPKSVVVNPFFDWGSDRHPRIPYHETVIYEAHVKGLTMRHPGLPEELRGTYAGLAHPAAIKHLKRLGVTAVELLPVHQFIHSKHLLDRGHRRPPQPGPVQRHQGRGAVAHPGHGRRPRAALRPRSRPAPSVRPGARSTPRRP